MRDSAQDTFRDVPIAKEPCAPNCASAGPITHTLGCPNVGKWPPGMVEERWPEEYRRQHSTEATFDVPPNERYGAVLVGKMPDGRNVYAGALYAEIERLRAEKVVVDRPAPSTRDPERIDAVLAKVREVWERYPDMRLSQLIVNACRTNEAVPGVFYTEDSKLQEGLEWLLSLGKA